MPKKNSAEMRKRKEEERRRADDQFTWRVLGVMLFLAVWTVLLYRLTWPVYLYAVPVGVAVLYLLAYIYPKEFTLLAVLVSGGSLGLWLLTVLYQRPGRWVMVAHIVFAAAIALSAVLIWLLRRKDGVVRLGRFKLVLMPQKAQYRYLFIACAALAVALCLSIALGRTAAWCAFAAMLGYLFSMAVYYTVKMM